MLRKCIVKVSVLSYFPKDFKKHLTENLDITIIITKTYNTIIIISITIYYNIRKYFLIKLTTLQLIKIHVYKYYIIFRI